MLSAFIPPCHHSYLQCSHRGELHFKYCCWKRDLRLLLESCTFEPLAAIQAVTLSVLIPEPRGRPHSQLSTRCTCCDCTVILGEPWTATLWRWQHADAVQMPASDDSSHKTKLSGEKKRTLNFIQSAIKQESSLPNQHPWENDWDNKCFHNLALLITKSGLLIQKHHSPRKKKKKNTMH